MGALIPPRACSALLVPCSTSIGSSVLAGRSPDRQYTDVLPVDEEPLVSLDEIRAAAKRLDGITVRTPLLRFGAPIEGDPHGRTRAWLKPENLQPIGAFKLRGAYNALAQLAADQRRRGVVTASSGNHGQGVARAARLLGMRAVVVMPSDAPAIKRSKVEEDGAEVVVVGPSSQERADRARAISEEEGLALIASYDHRHIIAGQGTAGLEIAEQMTALQDGPGGHFPAGPFTVIVPIGGGGLSSGIATAVKALRPDAIVVGAEPEVAADAHASLAAGHVVAWPAEAVGRTSADGLRTMAIGALTFRHLRQLLDGIVLVSETEIARAVAGAARDARLVLEPSGAVSLAAWRFHAAELPAEGPVVTVLSGGNIDPAAFATMVAQGEAAGG